MQNQFKYFYERVTSNSEIILITLLILFYLTEGATKTGILSKSNTIGLQAGLKIVVFIFTLLGLLIYKKRELLYIFSLVVIFILGQLFLENNFDSSILIYGAKYIFPIALLGFFSVELRAPKVKLLNTFENILLVNSILIIIGLVFDISYFNTYRGDRFGYNGLLISSSISTYFYMIGVSCFFIRYHNKVITNWKFWIVSLSALFVGTKSLVFGLILLIFFYALKHVQFSKTRWITLIIGFVIAFGFSYYLFFINPLFKSLIETHGFITSFLSLRDQLLIFHTLPFVSENWSIWNYFFGGTSNFELRPQMELLDVIFFWGILGGLSYLIFFYKSFFKNFSISNVNIISPAIGYSLVLLCLIAFITGNFFYNSSVVIYMIVLRENIVYTYSLQSHK